MKTLFTVLLLLLATNVDAQRWTVVTDTGVQIADNSRQVLAANNNRTYLRLENASDTRISCRFGSTAIANRAFTLASRGTVGDVIVFSPVSTEVLNCITPAGTVGDKLLMVLEGKTRVP